MALYRRGRIWYADYYVHGKRVQESTGTANRRKAEKYVACRIAETENGANPRPQKVLLQAFSEQYLEHAKLHKRSWVRDEQMLKHLNGFFPGVELSGITPSLVEKFKAKRAAEVTPASVNRELALLKHMFNLAEQWDSFNGKNPVKAVRFLPENNHQFRTISDGEEAQLLAAASPYLQDLVVFAINTGLRIGEILNLKWKEVDLERCSLQLLVRKNRQILDVPLNDEALKVIRAWHGMKKCEFVFYNSETGEQFKDLWLGLKKACKKAGLQSVNWHTFRHTFASRLTRRGVDLVTVKELLGHSEVSVTMRYAHTNHDAKARAVKMLSDKVVTIDALNKKGA